MKDLEKMQAKFAKELEMAKVENEMEERFGIHFHVLEMLHGDGLRIIAKGEGQYGLSVDHITPHEAACLVCAFDADTEQPLDASATNPHGTVRGMYRVMAERGFRESFTLLRVEWLHGGNKYEIGLKIDGEEILEKYFVNSTRKMDSSERETYKPTRRGHLVRELDLPIKRFICSHITYSRGYQSATDLAAINDIIETIKTQK